MSVDREQTRRRAEALVRIRESGEASEWPSDLPATMAKDDLALLAELEQARLERDEAQENRRDLSAENAALYSQLAAVPALVEALRNFLDDVDEADRGDVRLHDLQSRIGAMFLGYGGGHNHQDDLRDALAAVEQAQERGQ